MSDGTITPHSLQSNLQRYLGQQTRASFGGHTGESQRSTASEDESLPIILRLDGVAEYKVRGGKELNGDLKLDTKNTGTMNNEKETVGDNADQKNFGEKMLIANSDCTETKSSMGHMQYLQHNYLIGQHNQHANHHNHYHHNHHHVGQLHYHHLKRQARHLRHLSEHSLRIPLKLRKLGTDPTTDLGATRAVSSSLTDNGGDSICSVALRGKSNAIVNKPKISQSINNNNNSNISNNLHNINNGSKLSSSQNNPHHTADGSYQCQFCDKSFPRLGYLKKHEQV